MKILAISYMLPPMLYPQAIQIGRLLEHSRHEIVAVSGREFTGQQPSTHEACEGAKCWRIAVPMPSSVMPQLRSWCSRYAPLYGALPDAYRSWIEPAYRAIAAKLKSGELQPDLLVTFGEPMSDHLLGLRLKTEFGLPWIAHFSDPWSDNPFRRRRPAAKWLNRFLERRVMTAADACIFTSAETVELVLRKYPAELRKRVSVLPHAFDPALFENSPSERHRDTIMFRYIGNFYGHRSPRPLLLALQSLVRQEPALLAGVRFELVGGMPPRMLRSAALKSLPPELLRIAGTVPYQESIRLMQTADVLLVIDAPATVSVFFPSKLVDYIGAGRRVFGIVSDGAAKRIIAECGGVSVSPAASSSAIAELLKREILEVRAQRGRGNQGTGSAIPGPKLRYAISCVAAMFDDMCEATIRRVRDGRVH